MSNLKQSDHKEIVNKLKQELKISNLFAVPRLEKIVLNSGLGEALTNKKVIETVSKQLAQITGQKPLITKAKRDISSFKVRKGDAIGLKVTLRGKRRNQFLDRLVKIVLPRIRDFRGISSTGFDNRGSYTLGLREQIIFPEIEYSEIDKIRGLEITLVTSGKDKNQTKALLTELGLPFNKG